MAVSKRLRYEVLRRDNHACRYCGRSAPGVELTVDHVVPTALGGRDEPSNLVAACDDCNSGKSATPPDAPLVADVADEALRWRRAIEQASRALDADVEQRRRWVDFFDDVWIEGRVDYRRSRVVPRPTDWPDTLMRLVAAGLRMKPLREAALIAMRQTGLDDRSVWRYFCGICWRRVGELQERAGALLNANEVDGGDG